MDVIVEPDRMPVRLGISRFRDRRHCLELLHRIVELRQIHLPALWHKQPELHCHRQPSTKYSTAAPSLSEYMRSGG